MRVAELRKIWDKRYTALCHERKIRTIGGYGCLATDTYISSNALTVNQKGDDVHLSWWCEIKPLAIDPILWTIFMPETDLGSERKRLSLRVNGAFTATGLKIDRETRRSPYRRPRPSHHPVPRPIRRCPHRFHCSLPDDRRTSFPIANEDRNSQAEPFPEISPRSSHAHRLRPRRRSCTPRRHRDRRRRQGTHARTARLDLPTHC